MMVPIPGVLHVPLRDDQDEGEIDHQRGDDVHGRVADAIGRQHGLRRDPELHEERDEDRREDGPLRHRARHDDIEQAMMRMKPISSGISLNPASPSQFASFPAITFGMFDQLKRAMNWLIISSMKIRPDESGERLGHPGDGVVARLERARSVAEPKSHGQEEQRDDEDQAVHERRVADDVAVDGIAQRGATGSGQQR